MQNMVKCLFREWLDEKLESIDLIDYFGPVYHTKPEQFNFSAGDKRMIEKISEHVRTTIQKKGYGFFDGRNTRRTTQSGINDSDVVANGMKVKLFDAVSDLLQPYGENIVKQFKIDMVEVSTDGAMMKGRVRCILCDIGFGTQATKRKKRNEFYSQFRNGHNGFT